jgi:hypothetical protein
VPLLDLLLKKAGHLMEYGIFAVLLYRALGGHYGRRWQFRLALAWTIALAYAVSDEFHQDRVPGRTAASSDVLIDGVGALIGLLATRVLPVGRPFTPARDEPGRGAPPVSSATAEMPHRCDDGTPRAIRSDG